MRLFYIKFDNLNNYKNNIPTIALLASYEVAFRVAQCKNLHTIAEELNLPSAINMVSIMIGEFVAN